MKKMMAKTLITTTIAVVTFLFLLTAAITTTTPAADATLTTEQVAFYDDKVSAANEKQQALIAEALNSLLNKTAEAQLKIYEEHSMDIRWSEIVRATAPNGQVYEIEEITLLQLPHNFTNENGYTYRDNKIYKPDGTELFS